MNSSISKKINKLRLSANKIEDIEIFKCSVFSELKELDLSYNKIQNIKVFESSGFSQLESLQLNNNEISDISVLGKVKFLIYLKDLNIKNNKVNLEKYKHLLDSFSHIKYLDY